MNEAAKEIAAFGLNPDAYIAVGIVSLLVVAIPVFLRVYARTVLTSSFGLDDWFLILAFILFVADGALVVKSGVLIKRHGVVADLLEMSAYDFASMLMYLVDQALLKVSMALFFLRIPQQKWQVAVIHVSMAIYATFSVAFFFVVLFECGSPTGFNFVYGTCFTWRIMGPLNYIAAVLNAIVDWVFIITPILVVWQSMMSRRLKIQVCLVIMLGAFGSMVSVARIPLIKDLRIIHSLSYFGQLVPIVLLSLVETGVGLMAISLAALRPLIKRRKVLHGSGDEESLRQKSDVQEIKVKNLGISGHVVHVTTDHAI